MCITSPPYWSLRDYGESVKAIWDGDENCRHEWVDQKQTLMHENRNNLIGTQEEVVNKRGTTYIKKYDDKTAAYCLRCGAWRGQLGLEPTFELYIKHLCDIFDEVKRVLKNTGTCWVNIGDTYWGGKGRSAHGDPERHIKRFAEGKTLQHPYQEIGGPGEVKPGDGNHEFVQPKSLCCIPDRFKIEMINRGWICRNTIIWEKPNCMPSSAKDRFTVEFEYLFFFVKSNDTQYWTNSKTGKIVTKQPLGTKGIKGVDWDWQKIGNDYSGSNTKIPIEKSERSGSPRGRVYRIKKHKKVSLWTGHDYWFEQQFEKYDEPMNRWGGEKLKANGKSTWDKGTGQDTYRERNMRPNKFGRNKRCVWINNDKYEIIVNKIDGEKVFTASNIPHGEVIKCFGHWFYDEQNIEGTIWKIPTRPFAGAHFAVFPEDLIETPVRAGCPQYICKKCGMAMEKIYEKSGGTTGQAWNDHNKDKTQGLTQTKDGVPSSTVMKRKQKENPYKVKFKGYTDCGCAAGFRPGVLLDPFIGAGTSGAVARKLGRDFVGIELQGEYIPMANKRIKKVK